jgi:hypothetical protein
LISISPSSSAYLGQFTGNASELSSSKEDFRLKTLFIGLQTEIWEHYRISLQIFVPSALISEAHLHLLLYHVKKAFDTKNNISNLPAMEFLLYLGGQRQIKEALKRVGHDFSLISNDSFTFGLVLFGEPENVKGAIGILSERHRAFLGDEFKFNVRAYLDGLYAQNPLIISRLEMNLKTEGKTSSSQISSVDGLYAAFSAEDIEKALIDILNQKMVKLYLDNYKEIK